jgi:hypothetical protein
MFFMDHVHPAGADLNQRFLAAGGELSTDFGNGLSGFPGLVKIGVPDITRPRKRSPIHAMVINTVESIEWLKKTNEPSGMNMRIQAIAGKSGAFGNAPYKKSLSP